jgi:DNA mismatch repair protein MutL
MGRPASGGAAAKPDEAPLRQPWLDEDVNWSAAPDEHPRQTGPDGPPPASQPRGDPGPSPSGTPSRLRALAQLHRSYILCEGPEGLYVVDQHAAHERLIHNRLKADLQLRGLPSQGLLIPETFELGGREAQAAAALAGPLARLGFELAPFGGATWILKGAPGLLSPQAAAEALREMLALAQGRLRRLEGQGADQLVEEFADSWLHSVACRAAVKAGQQLSLVEMDQLIQDMIADEGGYCPHGRPTALLISFKELERRFGRT